MPRGRKIGDKENKYSICNENRALNARESRVGVCIEPAFFVAYSRKNGRNHVQNGAKKGRAQMRNYTKKFKREWNFFINPKTGKVTHNERCKACVHDCKQSHKAEIIKCPNRVKNTAKNLGGLNG